MTGTPHNQDDQDMLALQGGDESAFAALVERYEGQLLGFFLRNTRDRQLSEDLVQETLLKVYSQSWDYLPRGKFRGWMYRIARNLMIDDHRRKTHDALVRAVGRSGDEESDVLSRVAGEVMAPMDVASGIELGGIVDESLQTLPNEQRTTFVLHHFSGLPLPEVAEAMDVGLPTCKSRLRLAREKLRTALLRYGIRGHAEQEQRG